MKYNIQHNIILKQNKSASMEVQMWKKLLTQLSFKKCCQNSAFTTQTSEGLCEAFPFWYHFFIIPASITFDGIVAISFIILAQLLCYPILFLKAGLLLKQLFYVTQPLSTTLYLAAV